MRLRTKLGAATLGVVVIGGVAVGALYASRNAVGVRLARDYLRARGVPARIVLDRLDAGGAAGSLSLGPPDRPDLTVDRVEASFAPLPPLTQGVSAPRITAIRLIRPHLRARFDGRRLDLGSLQRLVDEAARAQPGGGPGPDVAIQDGLLLLATPAGDVALHVDAHLVAGRLTDLRAGLDPATLAWKGLRARGLGGLVIVREAGAGRLHADIHLGAAEVGRGAGAALLRAKGLQLTAQADAPQALSPQSPSAPVAIDAMLRAAETQGAGAYSGPGALDLRFAGGVGGPVERLTVEGKAVAALTGRKLNAPSLHVEAEQAAINVVSEHLRLARAAAGFALDAPLVLSAQAGGGLAALGSTGRLRVAQADLTAKGVAGYGPGGARLRLSGAAKAHGGLDPASAQAMAALAVAPSLDAKAHAVLARALSDVAIAAPALELALDGSAGRLTLRRPLRAEGAGETLSVAASAASPLAAWGGGGLQGAVRATLAGAGLPRVQADVAPYALTSGGGLEATVDAGAQGSLGPLRDADLHLAARVERRGETLTVRASRCAAVKFARWESAAAAAPPLLRDASATVCPVPDAPLLAREGRTWRVRAGVRGLAAALPGAQAAFTGADLDADAASDRAGLHGRLSIARAGIADLAPAERFRRLSVAGTVDLAGSALRADFAVSTSAHARSPSRPLGRLTVTQDLRADTGSALLDAPGLTFVRNGLQPGDIAPAAARFASQAQGSVDVSARIAWGGASRGAASGTLDTSGRVRTAGLDLRSPAGVVDGLAGDLTLTSLAPLTTAPAQAVSAKRVEAILPLTDISTTIGLNATGLDIGVTTAAVAHGHATLDPLHVGFAGGVATTGVLRLEAVDLGETLGVLNLSNAVTAQARLSGALPFAIGPQGVRITDGRLYATGPGRLTLRREALTGGVATAGAAGAQPNAVQDFAYQALENLAFDSLEATVASRDKGRLGLIFHIKGLHDPPKPLPTRLSLMALIRGKAFDKPIPLPKGTPVDLTLDTSINFDDLLKAYGSIGPSTGQGENQGGSGSVPVQP